MVQRGRDRNSKEHQLDGQMGLEAIDSSMAGHGYAVVSAGPDAIDTEFICIVRPIARTTTPDGGPLRYRVSHRARLWRPGTPPKLEQRVLEGDAKLSV
jgi:alkaline phosphatase D